MSTINIRDNVFVASTPAEIPVDRLRDAMKRYTFAGIRGIITPQEMEQGLAAIRSRFSRADDHPATGQTADKVRQNFQKLNVGGESRSRSNDDARLFRVIYNPIWADDLFGLRSVFIRLARVRNVIAGLPEDFALSKIETNGLWTAARIHQYPVGGGFFRGHTDYVASDVAGKAETDFFQVVLLMTQKGRDFRTGGAFVDIGEERIILEDHFGPGDILIYDGRTNHGVEDIDPHLPLDLDTFNGRVAAFVTLFKAM